MSSSSALLLVLLAVLLLLCGVLAEAAVLDMLDMLEGGWIVVGGGAGPNMIDEVELRSGLVELLLTIVDDVGIAAGAATEAGGIYILIGVIVFIFMVVVDGSTDSDGAVVDVATLGLGVEFAK